MCHSCQARYNHAQRYSACPAHPRRTCLKALFGIIVKLVTSAIMDPNVIFFTLGFPLDT
jgi:hypothetical protein